MGSLPMHRDRFFSRYAVAPAVVSDTLSQGRNFTDGETLVSAGGSFTLGFFSPGASTKRYLGIWFTVSRDAVCWVANRGRPLDSTSGVLVLSSTGSLLLLDGGSSDQTTVWTSNSTSAGPVAAQLLDSGNLRIRELQSGSSIIPWQSFDHPSDTLLPGMKIGKNTWSNAEWYLSSWRSADDPSPACRFAMEASGLPDVFLWGAGDGGRVYRTGPWNGVRFSGVTEAGTYSNMFAFHMTIDGSEVTFGYSANAGAPPSRIVATEACVVRRLVWEAGERGWETFFQGPRDVCDDYAKCGAFGLCDAGAASTSFCSCVKGFTPASPSSWLLRETSGGCRRSVALDCVGGANGSTTAAAATTDGFLVLRGVKLPDTYNASVDRATTTEECGARCLANCSCVAYAPADIQGGGAGTGCVMWTDKLIDLRYVDGGQDLYVRLPKSELGEAPHRPFPTALVGGIIIISLVAVLIILSVVFVIRRRQQRRRRTVSAAADDGRRDDGRSSPTSAVHSITSELLSNPALTVHFNTIPAPAVGSNTVSTVQLITTVNSTPSPASTARSITAVSLSTIKEATGDFSESNIIGRGGFSCVYEGKLPDGTMVAVKRLKYRNLNDNEKKKVKEDFEREVVVMSRLSHANLLELLHYCHEGQECILVYEYMQHRSLDLYIFGEDASRSLLDWAQRLEIIRGIAVGVAYLHEKKVIHRDIKPDNCLLCNTWKPKIADFSNAKQFTDDQAVATLVRTWGYVAPEYAQEWNLSLYCDVYSFGVVLLEIVSGKRNRTVPTLLLDVWESWSRRELESHLDSQVPEPEPELLLELNRCIQIGLLCVQPSPEDRPAMADVVEMLINSSSRLAMPNKPTVNRGAGPSSRRGEGQRLLEETDGS